MWLLVISPSSILCFYHGKLPELDSFWFVIYFKDINFGGYFLKKAFIWKKTELRLESRFVKFERKEIFYWKRWKKMPCCFKMVWMMHKDIFIRVNLVFIQIWRIIWPQNSIAKKSNVTSETNKFQIIEIIIFINFSKISNSATEVLLKI